MVAGACGMLAGLQAGLMLPWEAQPHRAGAHPLTRWAYAANQRGALLVYKLGLAWQALSASDTAKALCPISELQIDSASHCFLGSTAADELLPLLPVTAAAAGRAAGGRGGRATHRHGRAPGWGSRGRSAARATPAPRGSATPRPPPPPARDPRPRRFAPRRRGRRRPAPAAAGRRAKLARAGREAPAAAAPGAATRPAPPGPAQPGKSPRRVPPARLRPPRPPRPRGETPKERDQLTHGSAAGEAGDTSGFRGAGEVNCTEVQVVFSPIRSGRLKEGERGGGGGGGRVSLARSLSHTHAHTHTHTHTEAHACTHAHTHTRTRTRPLGSAPELPQQGGARTENTRAASCPRALWPPPAATPRAPAAAPLGQAALRDYPRFEVADGEKLRYRAGGLRGLGMPGCGQASPGGLCLPAVPLPRRAGSGAESRITVLLLPGVSPGTTCSVTLLENCLYS
nr:translation initiation factor IF-2-like [Taeniopygia guttata]